MKNKGIGAIVVVVVVVAVAAAAGGYFVLSGRGGGGTGGTYTGSGTETYSGEWSSNNGNMSGTWQFTVDWDSGSITGSASGDFSADVSGSVSGGTIDAEGEAAMGTVTWSGSFSSDGSEVSGTWSGLGLSGTWSGSKSTGGGTGGGETGGGETGGGESVYSSIDITISGYEFGEFQGGVRIKARELGSANPDVRAEPLTEEGVYIYNNDQQAAYIKGSSSGTWTKMTGTYATTTTSWATGLANAAYTWGITGTGDYSFQYGNESVSVTVNAINPTFDDSVFLPPSGATVEEVQMPSTE